MVTTIYIAIIDFKLIFSQGIDNFETDLNALHPILTECRVLKSAFELAVIQFANDISSEAHVEVYNLEPYILKLIYLFLFLFYWLTKILCILQPYTLWFAFLTEIIVKEGLVKYWWQFPKETSVHDYM